MATCVAVVEDGMVGVGDMTSCRNGDVRCSGGGWDGWDGRHDKLQRWQHALKRRRHALQWWGMGWLGWALWQAGGRCGRDILHEFIYR